MIKTKIENSITFHIETLDRPTDLVEEKAFSEIVQTFSNKIEYLPNPDEKLISGGYHSFLYGLYLAYSQHRPFTLSPDMIWLLVLQGISNHVNHQRKSGNDLFPQLSAGQVIAIRNDNIKLGDPTSPWHEATSTFSDEIEKILGADLVSELRADFSTTTLASKVVSEITIMDTFKAYFEYIIYRCICGIPEMTVEGSAGDWNHLLDKLDILKKYDLAWWHEDLYPIITKIRNTAQEDIDNEFWMNIFKIHTIEEYGSPKYIDGWITKFFPFSKNGGRIDLKECTGISIEDIFKMLPKQMIHVDFKHVLVNTDGATEKTDMEYWGGFVGITQDHQTQRLTPKIDWFVSHAAKEFERDIDIEKESAEYGKPAKMFYNISQIPEEVFEKQEWEDLGLFFFGKVVIPERFKDIKFYSLYIGGDIDVETTERLTSYYQSEEIRFSIYINGNPLFEKEEIPIDYEEQIAYIRETYATASDDQKTYEGTILKVVETLQEGATQHQNKNFTIEFYKKLVKYIRENIATGTLFYDEEMEKLKSIINQLEDKNNPIMDREKFTLIKHAIVDEYEAKGSFLRGKNLDFEI
ncbi:DUF4419 domain-containing protein [uncultured Kordia sp.]|uniref:DUF4419 domain-containing protein n=1 Tax=uncultured Kordia sp. TaxID=507699 RepID=UPI002633AC88|nr:DUF4419 domain-containing protein [uncultured Kordia sp.]